MKPRNQKGNKTILSLYGSHRRRRPLMYGYQVRTPKTQFLHPNYDFSEQKKSNFFIHVNKNTLHQLIPKKQSTSISKLQSKIQQILTIKPERNCQKKESSNSFGFDFSQPCHSSSYYVTENDKAQEMEKRLREMYTAPSQRFRTRKNKSRGKKIQ